MLSIGLVTDTGAAPDLSLLNYGMIAALILLCALLGASAYLLVRELRRNEAMSDEEKEPGGKPAKSVEAPSRTADSDALLQAIRTLQFNLEKHIDEAVGRSRDEILKLVQQEVEGLKGQLAAPAGTAPAAQAPAPDEVPAAAHEEPKTPGPPWPDSAREILQRYRGQGSAVAFNSFLGFYESKEDGPLLAFPEGGAWYMIPNTARLEDAQAFQDFYSEAFRSDGPMSRGSLFVVLPASLQKDENKEGRFTLRDKGTLSIKH